MKEFKYFNFGKLLYSKRMENSVHLGHRNLPSIDEIYHKRRRKSQLNNVSS